MSMLFVFEDARDWWACQGSAVGGMAVPMRGVIVNGAVATVSKGAHPGKMFTPESMDTFGFLLRKRKDVHVVHLF